MLYVSGFLGGGNERAWPWVKGGGWRGIKGGKKNCNGLSFLKRVRLCVD